MAQHQGNIQHRAAFMSYPGEEPAWQTEPAARVIRRLGLRSGLATRIVEPALEVPSCKLPTREVWDSMEWDPRAFVAERQPQIGRPSGARVATLARRVMAREWSRARHSRPLDVAGRRRGGAPIPPSPQATGLRLPDGTSPGGKEVMLW